MLLQTKNPHQLCASFNKEFEQFFEYCDGLKLTKSDKDKIFTPLKWKLRYEYWRQVMIIGIGLLLGISAIYYIPFLNWNFTAVGRIILIKLLPIWNWKPLHNQKCLIDWGWLGTQTDIKTTIKSTKFYEIDCSTCVNYGNNIVFQFLNIFFDSHIKFIENIIRLNSSTSYDYLYDKFLIRGRPVIVKDSCPVWQSDNFTDYLLSLDPLIDSNPCDLRSNLILEKYANLEELLVLSARAEPNDGWFLHFLNCDFESVKASRLITNRPAYLSTHLDPAQASWILMSNRYTDSDPIDLKVDDGLVVMLQLKGDLEISLSGKDRCLDECGEHEIRLDEGDGLVFTTDLWDLSYRPSPAGNSINFVTETRWNP